jgi:hypothetical protein
MSGDLSTGAKSRWTRAEQQIVTEGWAAGLTCPEIAERLPGRNRSAVLGAVHRLGLPKRLRGRTAGKARPLQATQIDRTRLPGFTTPRDWQPAPITLAGPPWSHPAQVAA